jgi:hypothetical protein
MATYINSINPLGNVYDGFLVLSTLGNRFRTDLTQPVFKVLTEFDVSSSEAAVRQPNTPRFRSWEVAGSSHVDQHLRDSREPLELRDNPLGTTPPTSAEAELAPTCQIPQIGTLTPTKDVVGTAFDDLVQWIEQGTPPPTAPYLKTVQINTGAPSVLLRNNLGLAEGGIQLPEVKVPTYLNDGTNVGPGACNRWGFHQAFPVSELEALYPSYTAYVKKVTTAANNDVTKGYIEAADAREIIYKAIQSGVGDPSPAQRQKALATFFAEESSSP